MRLARLALLPALCLAMVAFPPDEAKGQDGDQQVMQQAQSGGAGFDWDKAGKRGTLLTQMRGLATVALFIALVVAAVYVGVTGKSGPALFAAVGAIVLYGGFWIVLLIVQAFGAQPTGNPTVFTNPAGSRLVIAPIIRDFTTYGINMLTTAVMPFAIIYGFWMALGIASGETQNSGVQIKNYILGGTVAIGASIIVQVFTF
jgi:hypothetical protein